MADEEKNENTEEKDQAEKTPEAEEPKAEEKAPEAEGAPAPEDAPADDAPAEEAAAEDAPADDAPADEAPAAAGGDAGSDEDELGWKAKRRLERSRLPHEPGPQREPAQRDAERIARRKAALGERSRYRKRSRTKGEKGTGTPAAERTAVARKIRQGTVVSNKADKTITVRIDVARRHPTYEKIVRQSGTLHAHDERNEASEGDLVQVVETRPLSKSKRWRLTEILEKAK